MERRKFLKSATLGAAAAAVASPAIAQSTPELKWRLVSSFPKNLDAIFGAGELFTKIVSAMTDGKFQIQIFAAGEVVPGLQVMQAVRDGTVEMGHSASYYYSGVDPTFTLGTAVPFGLNSRMQDAWMFQGGGMELMNGFYAKHKIFGIPCGNTGTQMGGWFRKEVKTVEDLKGLKFRIGGYAGRILAELGAVPQQIAGGDIYPALEKGTIDAAEWVGPYDDQKLGLNKIAPFYYYPGWWEGGAMLHNFINLEKWNSLSAAYKAIVLAASHEANTWMQARYDARNPQALKELVGAGALLRPFSKEIMEASYKATLKINNEVSATNPDFKKINDALNAFKSDQYLWWQVAEFGYDAFMIQQRQKGF